MNKTILLRINAPDDAVADDVIQQVVDDLIMDPDSRELTDCSVSWDIMDLSEMLEIDPRQKQAAEDLLMAFDLPAEMLAASQLMLFSSLVNPGSTMRSMGSDNRKTRLLNAQSLIATMLAEIG